MITINKFYRFVFLLVPVISLLLLHGCGERDTKEGLWARVFHRELTPEDIFEQTKRSAESGDLASQQSLALMYFKGEGVPKDSAKGVEWLQKAAEHGDASARVNLGVRYLNGEGVTKDAATAVVWLRKAAEQGEAFAQFYLGWLYGSGEGVPKDPAKAMEWYEKAAEQGVSTAQNNLGSMYHNGEGVPKDNAKAMEWFRKAAEHGDSNAQNNLGSMYLNGEGGPADPAVAVQWYQKAAAQGNAGAQYNLGLLYETSLIEDDLANLKDDAKAIEWYLKAAEQGVLEAQVRLAWMYRSGKGVPKDFARAAKWFQKAAAHGHVLSQVNLGRAYLAGKGVPLDPARAYAWLNLAAAGGSSRARGYLAEAEAEMTSAQIAEGQFLSSKWKQGDELALGGLSGSANVESSAAPRKHVTGTAFVVSLEGHALTNNHVINSCKEVRVTGHEGIVTIITSDSVNDLALLQIPGKRIEVASLSPDLASLRQGEDVVVFGYPLNSLLSSGGNLTPGTVSALTGFGNNSNQIQITAPVQPGSSGSPVLNKRGNVVGVVSTKLDDGFAAKTTGQIPQNVNFAINGQTTRTFLDTNKVPYKTTNGWFSREKSNADIAEDARKWTVIVECWK